MDLHMNQQQYTTKHYYNNSIWRIGKERTTVKCIILQASADHAEHGQIR